MELDEYQHEAIKTRRRPVADPSQHLIVSLLGLAGEAGELISEYKKYLRDGENYAPLKGRICEELGDILWYIASVADEFDLSLSEVGTENLRKIMDRWSSDLSKGDLSKGNTAGSIPDVDTKFFSFDADFPVAERLPRRLQVLFTDAQENGVYKTQMRIEGNELGDPLTDNSYEDDGYRFHDIFHWTCAASLGWSPVLRKLLQRKRKSDLETDEVEDGARAAAIEEGISALVFSYAADRGFLRGATKVDSDLLRTIKGMTRHLEVSIRSAGDWERAVLMTFDAWRHLSQEGGGTVIVDLISREIAIAN